MLLAEEKIRFLNLLGLLYILCEGSAFCCLLGVLKVLISIALKPFQLFMLFTKLLKSLNEPPSVLL